MKSAFLVVFFSCVFVSCGIYSFYDASIPPEVKTIKINVFKNDALLVNPLINTMAANELISKIRNQTKLFIVNSGSADYEITGTITAYNVITTDINNSVVAKNQLTLSINYNFVNHIQDIVTNVKSADYPLSISEEFNATQTLSSVESSLLETMVPRITTQAFNKIFSTW